MSASEPATASPIVLPFLEWTPAVGSGLEARPGARIIGRSRLGRGCFLDACATIRGDGEHIYIGDDCWFGEHATVHIVHKTFPARIGTGVTVGHGAVVHAAVIGDGTVVCAGAIILDNARVGPAAVVARDTVVPPGKALAGGMLYAGVPALAVRPLNPGELAQHCLEERMLGADREKRRTEKHEKPAAITWSGGAPVLVCDTVCADGAIRLDGGVSIWFGTNIFCPNGKVEIGARSNIQDNTFVLVKGESALVIGRGVTVGHNATLEASRIMDGALVGMGAHVTHGTVIEEHACLAAGAVTLPNSVVTSGTLWAGRPARRIRALTEEEQAAFAGNADIYCDEYLNAYAKSSGCPNANI